MADKAQFLARIGDSSADVRFAAWRAAGEQDPGVVPELAELAGGTDPGIAKAAKEAMTTLTHSVGKSPSGAKRSALAKELGEVANGSYALPVRAHSLRLLSLIGDDDTVPAAAKLIGNLELREEAVFCLERMPGTVSTKALIAAYSSAPDDFKPRILAALGHRRAGDAVALCVAAMRSSNRELALAGTKAFGRIGQKPAGPVRFSSPNGNGAWHGIDVMDSQLRYADAQAAAGNHADAMVIYRQAMERPEEHWQCAGIIGLARLGTPEAAAAIFPKLKSSNRKVRITAANEWKRMAATSQA